MDDTRKLSRDINPKLWFMEAPSRDGEEELYMVS
jgi:hypothetical protein